MGTFFSSWSTPLLLKKGRAAAALLVLLEKLEFVILARVLVMVGGWGDGRVALVHKRGCTVSTINICIATKQCNSN